MHDNQSVTGVDNTTVSIIIPCYNTAQWIGAAIESCLAQTYRPIEIIVVDDGSTDDSVSIVQQFGDTVILETGPNRGGNHARNRAFELASGRYIQYLDADDFLLPEKIARQVSFLDETGADVVYGDWRHLHHLPDGRIEYEDIKISGHHDDILYTLLTGWWVPINSLLYKREVVEASGGWDTTLKALQDKDFQITLALSGATYRYQPGCTTIYRRFGKSTVSSGNLNWFINNYQVLEKARHSLERRGLLATYAGALAQSYFYLARTSFDLDRALYRNCIRTLKELDPGFRPAEVGAYNLSQKLFGFYGADLIASIKRKVTR
jgi:glycosyltransferase involved in cell wall biosynthesis